MNYPQLNNINCSGKRVIVRADLDVSVSDDGRVSDTTRLDDLLPTLNLLYEKGASQVVLIGHRGRPEGSVDMNFSLEPLKSYFLEKKYDIAFLNHIPLVEFFETYDEYSKVTNKLILLENLRFYKEEEENNKVLAEQLSYFGDMYVNEAFASSHRDHASISALPSVMKTKGENLVFVGLHFEKEILNLEKVRSQEVHPITFVISGVKEDKLKYLDKFKQIADHILIGGRLPLLLPEDYQDSKVLVAHLIADKEDITIHSIEQFEQIVSQSKVIFVSGPLGKYEEEGHILGTKRVLDAVGKTEALKVAGGGDTTAAIDKLNLKDKFNWVSTGGGASLTYIAEGTLPGLEALLH